MKIIVQADDEQAFETTLVDFLAENEDVDVTALCRALKAGEVYRGGGGAAGGFTVRRVRTSKRRDGAILDEMAGGYSDIAMAHLPVGALPSDRLTYLVPDDRQWDLLAWRRAYSRDGAALTGNPDGEAW